MTRDNDHDDLDYVARWILCHMLETCYDFHVTPDELDDRRDEVVAMLTTHAYREVPMAQQQPTVGRAVHYQSYGTPGGEHPSVARAAIITAVLEEGEVSLAVLNPTGLFFDLAVPFAE